MEIAGDMAPALPPERGEGNSKGGGAPEVEAELSAGPPARLGEGGENGIPGTEEIRLTVGTLVVGTVPAPVL